MAKFQYVLYAQNSQITLWPLFVDGVLLPQGYRATSRRQFTFYHQVPRTSWYSFDRLRKDERLSRPWSHPVVLNTEPLDWESSALTSRPLLHKCNVKKCKSIQDAIVLANEDYIEIYQPDGLKGRPIISGPESLNQRLKCMYCRNL